MKDKQREEDLRNSLDPKYAHLNEDLHVEVSALGPPAEGKTDRFGRKIQVAN